MPARRDEAAFVQAFPAVVCCDLCPDFVPRECPAVTDGLCVRMRPVEKSACDLPRFRYDARRAQKWQTRGARSRARASPSPKELARMLDIVVPLIENGLSPGGGMDVEPRSAGGLPHLPVLDGIGHGSHSRDRAAPQGPLPPAQEKKKHGPAAARPGREYADFFWRFPRGEGLCSEVDSVIGYAGNRARILNFHAVRGRVQFYCAWKGRERPRGGGMRHAGAGVGGPELFRAAFGVMVVDRGEEFADWEGIERSCLVEGANRCHVYYCDPMRPGQRAIVSATMQSSGRILPKGRSDFDALTGQDLSLAATYPHSNPRASLGGKRPIDGSPPLLPEGLLDALGITAIPIEEMIKAKSARPCRRAVILR